MASVGHSAYGHEVVYDDTPISLHQADILDRLGREANGALTLQELFVGRTRKSEMIGLFLATLELIRQKKITIEQTETLGEVRIILRTDAPEQMLFENENAGENPSGANGQNQSNAVADGPEQDGAEQRQSRCTARSAP